jgi:hypothetical protein
MIHDLDETLKQLLIRKGEIDPDAVDIRFDPPAPDLTGAAKPVVDLYLYDIRENAERREVYWDTTKEGDHRVRITRRPLRIDLSYLVMCLAGSVQDQHRLVWKVLEILFRNSPLPDDILQGDLGHLLRPALTQVAQTDGLGAATVPMDLLGVAQSRWLPAIRLVVTLELDLEDVRTVPLVFARTYKFGQSKVSEDAQGREILADRLEPGWEAAPAEFGGVVRSAEGEPLGGIAVRLIAAGPGGRPIQVGPSTTTDESGRYLFRNVPLGAYDLVIEAPGQSPVQRPIRVAVGERGELLPDLVLQVEVPQP